MHEADQTRARLQKMRDKAQELQSAADRASDSAERDRLKEKARRLRSATEEESMERGGDIYPST